MVTRRRGVRVLLVVAAALPLLFAGGAAPLTVVLGGTCSGSGVGDSPSATATRDIPAALHRIYEQVGAQYKIPWEILAALLTEAAPSAPRLVQINLSEGPEVDQSSALAERARAARDHALGSDEVPQIS